MNIMENKLTQILSGIKKKNSLV